MKASCGFLFMRVSIAGFGRMSSVIQACNHGFHHFALDVAGSQYEPCAANFNIAAVLVLIGDAASALVGGIVFVAQVGHSFADDSRTLCPICRIEFLPFVRFHAREYSMIQWDVKFNLRYSLWIVPKTLPMPRRSFEGQWHYNLR